MLPVPRWRRSLRGQLLLAVLVAAILPLTGIGLWLTSAATRAGEELRRSEMRLGLAQLEERVLERWEYRRADLLWLAENEIVRREMQATIPARAAPQELQRLLDEAGPGIESLRYLDAAGRLRWELVPTGPLGAAPRGGSRPPLPSPAFAVRLPVADFPTDRRIGTLEARVRLSAVLPADTLAVAPRGMTLAVFASDGSPLLIPDSLPSGALGASRFDLAGEEWIAETHALGSPPLRLSLAAPLQPVVAPFRRAARTGLAALLVVCAVALAGTVALTRRLTRSLGSLVGAADAVAAGDLRRHVSPRGPDEVDRVAAAFNTMAESLRQTLDQLAQRRALAAVGEFAASLSHEIRNAHTSIRLDLQRARRKIPVDSPARELVERALHQIERLDRTVTGSLRAARSGRIDPIRLDLRSPLLAAVHAARTQGDPQEVTIRLEAPEDPVEIQGDADALEHLFLNLLLNALDASEPHSSVEVDIQPGAEEVLVRVGDSGPGLSTVDPNAPFQPFYSTKPGGTGLGLAIARSIVEAHGGRIALRPGEARGTLAEVFLPLPAPPPRPGIRA